MPGFLEMEARFFILKLMASLAVTRRDRFTRPERLPCWKTQSQGKIGMRTRLKTARALFRRHVLGVCNLNHHAVSYRGDPRIINGLFYSDQHVVSEP